MKSVIRKSDIVPGFRFSYMDTDENERVPVKVLKTNRTYVLLLDENEGEDFEEEWGFLLSGVHFKSKEGQ